MLWVFQVPSSTAWTPLDVVVRPVVEDRGQLGVGRVGLHVGGLAEAVHAALLGDLQRRRAVGVLADDVGALVDQRLGGVALLARVVPGVDPDHLHLRRRAGPCCIASVKALMPITTSGIGNEPM